MPPPSSRSASPAADIAAALGARAEAVCRRYLPQGKKQGRYWVAGDLEGARGRSLFVRLHGPGVPGKWTDAATGEHGDLLDLVRHRSGAPRPEPSSPRRLRRRRARATTQRKRPAASGGVAAPSAAPMPRPISAPVDSRAAGSRHCASIPSFAIAKALPCAVFRRWSPP